MVPAIPQEVRSLRTGALSWVLHIPFEAASKVPEMIKMQGKSVRVEIYLEGE